MMDQDNRAIAAEVHAEKDQQSAPATAAPSSLLPDSSPPSPSPQPLSVDVQSSSSSCAAVGNMQVVRLAACGERFHCLLGPHRLVLLLTVALVLCPTCFLVVASVLSVAARLWLFFLAVFSLSSLLSCAFSDPGIIRPSLSSTVSTPQSASLGQPSSSPGGVMSEVVTFRRHSTGETISTILVAHFCDVCHVMKPFRASHCRLCNVCVLRRDHHCPWTGTCIGQRNYRYFFAFVTSTFLLACSGLVASIASLGKRAGDENDGSGSKGDDGLVVRLVHAGLQTRMIEPTIALVCFAAMLLLGGLTWYHTMLVLENMTSIEDHKRQEQLVQGLPVQPNPFFTSYSANCEASLCSGKNIPSAL